MIPYKYFNFYMSCDNVTQCVQLHDIEYVILICYNIADF